jgi:hypothetical protein
MDSNIHVRTKAAEIARDIVAARGTELLHHINRSTSTGPNNPAEVLARAFDILFDHALARLQGGEQQT